MMLWGRTTVGITCPHCLKGFHAYERTVQSSSSGFNCLHVLQIGKDVDGYWWIEKTTCPGCQKFVIRLVHSYDESISLPVGQQPRQHLPSGGETSRLIRPQSISRPPVPTEVPKEFSEDYQEACLVLAGSPKASAALSRRCLQLILREKAGVLNPDNLVRAIGEAIDDPSIPTDIKESLDAVRNIGNFASHPNKSLNTGEIVPVEPQEAEWCLEVIEMLFEFYFVRPADVKRRRDALNEKLTETGKPGILTPREEDHKEGT